MEETDVKKMIDENLATFKTEITEMITRAIKGTTDEKDFKSQLEEAKAQLKREFEAKLQEMTTPQPTALEAAYAETKEKVGEISEEINTLRSSISALKKNGHDASDLERRVVALENVRESIVKEAATAVTAAVQKELKPIQRKVDQLYNTVEERSPMSVTGRGSLIATTGFKAMLEASQEGGDEQ